MNKAINKFLVSSFALLIFTSVGVAGNGSARPRFAPATNFATGLSPQVVAVGDFNLDGKPDLATANQESNSVSVLLGDGSGGFGPKTDFPAGNVSFAVAVADINRDGMPDLVTANLGGDNVSVLLGDGTGGFEPKIDSPTGRQPSFVAVGDFNTDGNPDLAVANEAGNDVSILLGNASGAFRNPVNFAVGTFPVSVAVGDFNLDNIPDLVTANLLSNNLSVLLGEGLGRFGPKTDFPVGVSPVPVAIGDFNNDYYPDLATANFGPLTGAGPSTVSVLLGNGYGGFGEKRDFPVPNGAIWVTVGDFNVDRKLDLATANQLSNSVSVLSGNGYGDFSEPTNFAVGSFPFSVTAADFDLNGLPDLVAANSGSDNVSVLLNDLPHRCPRTVRTWKNTPFAWPVDSLMLGGRFYGRPRLLSLLNAPTRGDASLIMGQQLIAAKLNLANASNPRPINSTIAEADELLSKFRGRLPFHVKSSSAIGQEMLRNAEVLEEYNTTLRNCVP